MTESSESMIDYHSSTRMPRRPQLLAVLFLLFAVLSRTTLLFADALLPRYSSRSCMPQQQLRLPPPPPPSTVSASLFALHQSRRNEEDDNDTATVSEVTPPTPASLPQRILLCLPAIVVLYSEYTLKTTGCGLPAGPGGVVGAVEGVSYLGVVGIAGLSLYSRLLSGNDDTNGASTIPTAATALTFLAIAVGGIVLAFQLLDYGYIPNAVPMEGGMCQ